MYSIVLMGSLAPTSTSNCDDYTIMIGSLIDDILYANYTP